MSNRPAITSIPDPAESANAADPASVEALRERSAEVTRRAVAQQTLNDLRESRAFARELTRTTIALLNLVSTQALYSLAVVRAAGADEAAFSAIERARETFVAIGVAQERGDTGHEHAHALEETTNDLTDSRNRVQNVYRTVALASHPPAELATRAAPRAQKPDDEESD